MVKVLAGYSKHRAEDVRDLQRRAALLAAGAAVGDFTGDGWPDVLLASTSGTRLYVNPKGEPRRWRK